MEPVHEKPKPKSVAGIFEKLGSLPKTILGRDLEPGELIIAALIILLLTGHKKDRKKEESDSKESESFLNLNGIKDFLGKLGDKDILMLMLLYIMW